MSKSKDYNFKRYDTPLSTYNTVHKVTTARSNMVHMPKEMSDSEESIKSTSSETASSGNSENLSITALFDDLMRCLHLQRCDTVEDAFLNYVKQSKHMNEQWQLSVQECKRLQSALEKLTFEYKDLDFKLDMSRKLLDQEKKRSRRIEEDRNELTTRLNNIEVILRNTDKQVPDEALTELSLINNSTRRSTLGGQFGDRQGRLSAIQEINSTGSLLSDFSYSRSEDDLDESVTKQGRGWTDFIREKVTTDEPAAKKRRSLKDKVVEINATDTVRATTTLTVSKDGPITATSIIESLPTENVATPKAPLHKASQNLHPSAPPAHLIEDLWQPNAQVKNVYTNIRQHSFQTKTALMPETCAPCGKRMNFGKSILKCKDCRAVCHPGCKQLLPLPCTRLLSTPTQGSKLGVISEYTLPVSPMVPALVVHCLREVECRGLNELGIYRVPGSEREVKSLKEKFLKGKAVPILSNVDIHVVCGTVKDFLRSLEEPLVTYARWNDFVNAVSANDVKDVAPALFQLISELPQPNRDTLAYLILHLLKVSASPDCKMPIENLAKVFGPTIIGYSCSDPTPMTLITETVYQTMVMQELLNLPPDYWKSLIHYDNIPKGRPGNLQQTPSTDSLLYVKDHTLCTPINNRTGIRSKRYRVFSP